MTVSGLYVQIVNPDGSYDYAQVSKFKMKKTGNAATEITIELDNTEGLNSGIARFNDTINIEVDYD